MPRFLQLTLKPPTADAAPDEKKILFHVIVSTRLFLSEHSTRHAQGNVGKLLNPSKILNSPDICSVFLVLAELVHQPT